MGAIRPLLSMCGVYDDTEIVGWRCCKEIIDQQNEGTCFGGLTEIAVEQLIMLSSVFETSVGKGKPTGAITLIEGMEVVTFAARTHKTFYKSITTQLSNKAFFFD